MNYCQIIRADTANGEGFRLSLFASGCRNHCPGCFQKETWDFNYGEPFTKQVQDQLLRELAQPFYEGITILGGEPFEPENQKVLLPFIQKVKSIYPNKDIWCWTGYTIEELIDPKIDSRAKCEYTLDMLKYIDILVDGEFIEELKDISLLFRGSSNQRIINLSDLSEIIGGS